jgi:hypothetical protein
MGPSGFCRDSDWPANSYRRNICNEIAWLKVSHISGPSGTGFRLVIFVFTKKSAKGLNSLPKKYIAVIPRRVLRRGISLRFSLAEKKERFLGKERASE